MAVKLAENMMNIYWSLSYFDESEKDEEKGLFVFFKGSTQRDLGAVEAVKAENSYLVRVSKAVLAHFLKSFSILKSNKLGQLVIFLSPKNLKLILFLNYFNRSYAETGIFCSLWTGLIVKTPHLTRRISSTLKPSSQNWIDLGSKVRTTNSRQKNQ